MKTLDVTSVLLLTLVLASPSAGETQARQVLMPSALCSDHPDAAIATFEDANLEARVRSALSVGAQDDLTCGLVSGLTRLDAYRAGIESLVGIQNLKSLTFLRLRNNSITDIGALSGLTSLGTLSLSRIAITEISALSGLTNLTALSLHQNSITDISALSGLTSLTYLNLRDNSVTDISALSRLTNLTRLELYNNSITDISALSGLTSLPGLNLSGNSITDITPLSGLTRLTSLNLNGNSITDVGALSRLTSLTALRLQSNSITDISALSGLTSLTTLEFDRNSITEISPLSGLTSLTTLGLRDNSITDISVLNELTSLTDVALTGVICTEMPGLAARGVGVTCLPRVVPRVRTGLGVQGAPYSYSDPAALGLDPESVSSLGDLVVQWVQEGRIVGAEIMVLKDRRVVLHEAIGWSDNVRREPMRRNSIFDMRSMTKPFMGTSVLILAGEGRLNLDDPVSRYLPSFRNERSRSITLRQALGHTSGLGLSWFGPPPRDTYGSLRELADAIGELGPSYPLGEAFHYSDPGFATLGAVVEEVSGLPAERFIETRILEPLGMTDTHTRFTPDAPWAERVNSTHTRSGILWKKVWDNTGVQRYPFFRAWAGSYSTVMDYAKFLVAWMDGGAAGDIRILSEASVAEALTQSSHGDYGLSWTLFKRGDFGGLFTFGHGGHAGTVAQAVPEQDLLVFYFTQSVATDTAGVFLRKALQALVPPRPAR